MAVCDDAPGRGDGNEQAVLVRSRPYPDPYRPPSISLSRNPYPDSGSTATYCSATIFEVTCVSLRRRSGALILLLPQLASSYLGRVAAPRCASSPHAHPVQPPAGSALSGRERRPPGSRQTPDRERDRGGRIPGRNQPWTVTSGYIDFYLIFRVN